MGKSALALIAFFLGISAAQAGIETELRHMEGWCIVAVKMIGAYIDDDGKKHDGFQGCRFNRKIVFTDGTYLTCVQYGHQYAFRPDAVIFAKNVTHQGKKIATFRMLVEGDMYHMR